MAIQSDEEISNTSFTREMQRGFSEYASYVISDRALPDARDGMKPVHRRIIYAMYAMGIGPRSPFKKCARIVGETTGKYHPHAGGVYETLVRLGQDWSLRYPLVEPQGNFGSIDGYPPAAMRYTEARLDKISLSLTEGISPKIVEFIENFDGTEQEPTVLPVKIPHLLLNGSYGIAVGISSNIPPHNLTELMKACIAIVDNPTITTEQLLEIVKAPDFPTGGTIVGLKGIRSLFATGQGSMRLRSKAHLETSETHKKIKDPMIVITEIPYLQNKAKIIEHIATLIDDGKLRGVRDVKDLSKDKIRIEIVIREDFADELSVKTILAQLYQSTNLETLFHARINAFVYGAPRMLNLKQAMCVFLDFREVTLKRIAEEELEKVLARLHILEGLIIASDHIDAIIALIRASESRSKAQEALMKQYNLSELQAKAVLDMTLGRLARMEQNALKEEEKERRQRKEELEKIIKHRPTLLNLMKGELQKIIDSNPKDKRRTDVIEVDDIHKSGDRPILHQRDLLVTVTDEKYIRTIEYTQFKLQGRGGKGVIGLSLNKGENITDMKVISNLDDVLLLTEEGNIFKIPAYDLPEVKGRTSRGTQIKRHLEFLDGTVVKVVNIEHDKFTGEKVLVTVSKRGIIKRTTLDKYANIRRSGIRCLVLKEDDDVIDAFITENESFIFIATKNGNACLFDESDARLLGRVAQGVKGIKLKPGDEVVSAFAIPKSQFNKTSVLTVTNKGRGKRTPVSKYRLTKRGAQGVINIKTLGQRVITSMPVSSDEKSSDNISLINSKGIIIKVRVGSIRNMGRSTQGVRIMRTRGNEEILLATSVQDDEEVMSIEAEDNKEGEDNVLEDLSEEELKNLSIDEEE